MFWGILIGVVLTVLTVVIAVAVGKKDLAPLSYIVLVVALLAFCIEGVSFVNAIAAKRDISNKVAAIQEAARTYMPSDAQDYRLGLAEATGVKIGMHLLYPEVARYIDPDELAGCTVDESTEVLRQAVLRNAGHRIWMNVLYMAITLVMAGVLIYVSTGIGGGGSRRRGGRVQVHGRPRRTGGRRSRR